MLSLLQAAALILTTATTATPPGCPETAAEADALLTRAAEAANLPATQRMMGRYAPVSIERLGGLSNHVSRLQSGVTTKHLSQLQFRLDGTLADYNAPFLAAHPARTKFKVDCNDERCAWRPADGRDMSEDRIDALAPPTHLYIARLAPSDEQPGRVVLTCAYRTP